MSEKGASGGLFIQLLQIMLIMLTTAEVCSAAGADAYLLVTNPANTIQTISRQEVKRIFLGKARRWPDGSNVAVIINREPSVFSIFCTAVLKRTPYQFMIVQKKILFSGQGMPPPMVETDQEVILFISSHPGGLGYISPASLTSAVKILAIEQQESE